ncbi:MAG: Fe-S protein assembly co-chaperone HscB [Thiomargarita sp.]|nr:Fe-S protein assembly co-chaperone HscB [Thiomargarita sp.]
MNHFEVFNLPVSFEIDTDNLAQRYRDLQRVVHPDKYVNAPDRERRLAMQKAVQVNEAFQILKNPLNRGLYILQLQGIDTNDNSAMDSEFLIEQMDLREELADLREKTQPFNALSNFINRLEKNKTFLIDILSQQFAQKEYQLALESTKKFQFFKRLHEEALSLEEDFF